MSIKKHFIPLINVSPVDNGVFRDEYQKHWINCIIERWLSG